MLRDFVGELVIPLVAILAISITLIVCVDAVVHSVNDGTTYAVTLPSGETLHGLQLKYDSLESERTRFTTPDGKTMIVKGPHVIVEETQAERGDK